MAGSTSAKAAEDYFPDWVRNARLGWVKHRANQRLTKRYTVEGSGPCSLARLIRRLEATGTFDELGLVVEKNASQA